MEDGWILREEGEELRKAGREKGEERRSRYRKQHCRGLGSLVGLRAASSI